MCHQFIEHHQVHILETLPFHNAPVVVTTFKQLAAIEINGPGYALRRFGVEVLSSRALSLAKTRFKFAHIKPVVSAVVEVDPIRINHQQAIAGRGLR